MAIDPTQTTVLRRRYNAAAQRRIRELQRNVRHAVRNRDMLGLDNPFANRDIVASVDAFLRFFDEQVNLNVLEVVQPDGTPILPRGTQWQDDFVEGLEPGVAVDEGGLGSGEHRNLYFA